jgi:hypothetical protein
MTGLHRVFLDDLREMETKAPEIQSLRVSQVCWKILKMKHHQIIFPKHGTFLKFLKMLFPPCKWALRKVVEFSFI